MYTTFSKTLLPQTDLIKKIKFKYTIVLVLSLHFYSTHLLFFKLTLNKYLYIKEYT